MADNSVDPTSLQCEQRTVTKFPGKEGTPVVEIVKRLKAVFAEETLSTYMIYEWAKQFKEGHTSVDDDKWAGAPRTAVTTDNIAAVDLAIKHNRRISVLELSSNIGISVGSIDTIIHEYLLYGKITAKQLGYLPLREVWWQSVVRFGVEYNRRCCPPCLLTGKRDVAAAISLHCFVPHVA
jgi:hypothetical protein